MTKWLLAACIAAFSISSLAEGEIEAKYKKSCYACHAFGANNAPKTGDAEAWAPRLEKGMDTLVTHVRDGFNTMPPKGLCFDCSDEDYQALIEYMAAPQQ